MDSFAAICLIGKNSMKYIHSELLQQRLFKRPFPVILQTESTECGLACVAMLANYFGKPVTLRDLRLRFSVSLKGVSLGALIRVAKWNGLASRAVRTELEGLHHLQLPCVLHWNFNHFVILKDLKKHFAVIVDPANGERRISMEHLSSSFTGVALEVWPNADFQARGKEKNIPLSQLIGNVRGQRRAIFYVLMLAFALEFFIILTPYYLQLIIDNVIVSNDNNFLFVLGFGFAIVFLLKNLTSSVRAWFLMYIGTSLNIQWKENVLSHLLTLPIEYFEKRHIGDVTSRLGSIDVIQRMLTTSFIESMLDGFMAVIILLIIFLYQPLLATIVLTGAILYFLLRWVVNSSIVDASKEEIVQGAKQNSFLIETVRGMKQIKLYHQQTDRASKWISLFVKQMNAKVRTQKLDIFLKGSRSLILDFQSLIVISLGAALVISGEYSVGALVAFLGYKLIFETRVSNLIDNLFVIQNIRLQLDRLSDIVLSTPDEAGSELEICIDDLPATLECKNITFQYSFYEKNIIEGLELRVEDGESVAIIGSSGCGKSTFFSVLLGIYRSFGGQILIGGKDSRTLGIDNVRQIFGTVLQDDILFSGSIGDNISCFSNNADLEWIIDCAKMANIHDEIDSMPMKYHTLVGDMGTVLSGGQKQRVLLARALYKRPKILLLDEATSHLDLENERAVCLAISSLNITRIIIAHRPETVLSANKVLFMKNGRIVRTLGPEEAKSVLHEINSGSTSDPQIILDEVLP